MLPKYHPLTKTSIDVRRAILRLEQFAELNPDDPEVASGTVSIILEDFKQIQRHIPKDYREQE